MSNSPPWMPLNIGDYLRDTGHLTVVEHGAYMLLIMRYWQDQGLPDNEKLIARYAHLTAEQWSESKDVLAALFDEGWKHKRIDAELAKASEIIEKRRTSGQQRHSKSLAHAEQENGKSSYAGVPPSPLPEQKEDKSPALIPVASGARDLFDEIWEAFPQNPSSSEAKAASAFDALTKADGEAAVQAARHYRTWFIEDCAARKRTFDAGARFVPHLATWLESGAWREAMALPTKAQKGPVMAMLRLDRDRDRDLWIECESLQGKPAPTSDSSWAFPVTLVDEARKNLAAARERAA